MKAPIIGITSNLGDNNDIILRRQYCDAATYAGGIPLVIPPFFEPSLILNAIDGLILSGGGDISPELFGVFEYDAALVRERSSIRDSFELSLARLAYEQNKPTLGICRGIQVMNVALGGTLLLDIPGHSQTLERSQASHHVRIEDQTHLSRIISNQRILSVNSFHHQAVDRISPMLIACAFSSDGIVEAIESRDDRFYIGVQWHPEHMTHTAAAAPIAALIDAACKQY